MLLYLHPQNPDERKLKQVIECLNDGGVIIYPTDTIYGIGCNIHHARSVEQVCRIKGIKPDKALLSFVCNDLSHLSQYTLNFDRSVYKLMKSNLPGAFTFILPASNEVPKLLLLKRKTVGIRVPDHAVPQAIVASLGSPLLSASLPPRTNDVLPYPTDPEEIYALYGKQVDMVIDSGEGGTEPSTIVDCTGSNGWEITRQGKGELLY